MSSISKKALERLKRSTPWTPTLEQLFVAVRLADAFYGAGFEDEYSLDQFLQDIEDNLPQVANDGPLQQLAEFTDAMLTLLHAYGEQCEWRELSPEGYKSWTSSIPAR